MVIAISSHGQDNFEKAVGTYTQTIGDLDLFVLELNEDSTFYYWAPDHFFPETMNYYENHGSWTFENETVILNPHLDILQNTVRIEDEHATEEDSIVISINHVVQLMEDGVYVGDSLLMFDVLTVFINKKRKFHTLVRHQKIGGCMFVPKYRNQYVIDSTNTITLPVTEIDSIGISTYGFDQIA